jgi:hypothetical protein
MTAAWLPARVDHTTITGNCVSCHNGTSATGKPGNHFVTTIDCASCHTVTAFTPARNYLHTGAGYPGTHAQQLGCTDCHTSNAQTVPYRFPNYVPNCASCHAGNFQSGPHKKYETPNTVNYTVSELRDCTGACHIYTNSTLTTIKERRPSEHRVSDGEF